MEESFLGLGFFMVNNFGRNYPALVRVGRRDERERIFFFAAAGLAAFLFFTVIFVLNFKDRAVAKEDIAPVAMNPMPASMGTVTLLAPEKFIRAGTRLSEVRFKEVYWPRANAPEEAVRDIAEMRSMYAAVDVAEGAPITRSQLTNEALSIALPLTSGNRAVSIEVDATAGIEGWALPGSKVDVVLTYMSEGQLTSKVIVQLARVLSYGGSMDTADKVAPRLRGARETKKTITLDVSPEDALKITTAREMGRLSLMMRAPEDVKAVPVMEMEKRDFESDQKRDTKRNCVKGSIRADGREFLLNCDGTRQEISSIEP